MSQIRPTSLALGLLLSMFMFSLSGCGDTNSQVTFGSDSGKHPASWLPSPLAATVGTEATTGLGTRVGRRVGVRVAVAVGGWVGVGVGSGVSVGAGVAEGTRRATRVGPEKIARGVPVSADTSRATPSTSAATASTFDAWASRTRSPAARP